MTTKLVFCLLLCVALLGVTGESDKVETPSDAEYYIRVIQSINRYLPVDVCQGILNRIYGDDIALHIAVMWQETDFRDSTLICDNGRSHGYYQIGLWEARVVDKSATTRLLLTVENVRFGSRYLEFLIGKYGVVSALKRYNGSYRYACQVIARKYAIDSGKVFRLTPRELRRLRLLKTMDEAERFS
jgi:hypothetical protein